MVLLYNAKVVVFIKKYGQIPQISEKHDSTIRKIMRYFSCYIFVLAQVKDGIVSILNYFTA